MSSDSRLPASAVAFMENAHRGQLRKHGTPYSEHPLAVARILLDAWPGAPQWAVETALLHDVPEQSDATFDDLRQRFGKRVAEAVDLLTLPDGDGKDRLQSYYRRLAAAALDVRCIKLADRIHNLHQLPLSGDPAFIRRYLAQTELYLLNLVSHREAGTCAHAASLRERLHSGYNRLRSIGNSG